MPLLARGVLCLAALLLRASAQLEHVCRFHGDLTHDFNPQESYAGFESARAACNAYPECTGLSYVTTLGR